MAHWVSVVEGNVIAVEDSKTAAIREIAQLFTGNSHCMPSVVKQQLEQNKGESSAYDRDGNVIAKVLPCTCGSIKRHFKKVE